MQKALKRYAPLFVVPTLAAFVIGFIIPFIEGIYLSFCQFTTVGNAKFTGLSNYVNAFTDRSFLHSFGFTVAFAAVSIVLINVAAFGLASLLTTNLKGKNIFRTVFFMPNVLCQSRGAVEGNRPGQGGDLLPDRDRDLHDPA